MLKDCTGCLTYGVFQYCIKVLGEEHSFMRGYRAPTHRNSMEHRKPTFGIAGMLEKRLQFLGGRSSSI